MYFASSVSVTYIKQGILSTICLKALFQIRRFSNGMMYGIVTWLYVLLPLAVANTDDLRLIKEAFAGYDSKVPPNSDKVGKDRQVIVSVNMYIVSLYSISEANMDYSMTMFLRERWLDSRLNYSAPENFTRLELAFETMEDVWLPDLFILNEKKSGFHQVTVPNKLMHIYPDGTVQYSARVTGTFSCSMDLQKYPFDSQECHLDFESYGRSMENLKFQWSEDSVSLSKNITFPQFHLSGTHIYNCEKAYYGIMYTCIGVRFTLARNFGYFITQIYVPSVLVVALSWVSFWLDCEAVPARISLGLLTVLTMTTQSSGARADLPKVSYIKAIDVWMAVCLIFVFAGLVEFAYVNVLSRSSKWIKQTPPKTKTAVNGRDSQGISEENVEVDVQESSCKCLKWIPCLSSQAGKERAMAVDKISRILFPLIFIIFNAWYWIFYIVAI